MVFEHIDQLKKSLTDKLVIVAEDCPELRRFKGLTGTIKTVNMSGRALVEFDGNNNIGWYDIDPEFLTIIVAPLPKPEAKREAKPEQPAAKAAPAKTPAKEAAAEKAAPAKPAAGKGATADILAAARG